MVLSVLSAKWMTRSGVCAGPGVCMETWRMLQELFDENTRIGVNVLPVLFVCFCFFYSNRSVV